MYCNKYIEIKSLPMKTAQGNNSKSLKKSCTVLKQNYSYFKL